MASRELIRFARATSRTAAWSLSFYPQPILNLRRRSTAGTTPAFPFINVLGFISYLISTLAFYSSPMIRGQYAIRNPSSPKPTVRLNDVVFALHAVIMSTLGWSQFSKRIWGFSQGTQNVGRVIWALAVSCVLAIVLMSLFVASRPRAGYDPAGWAWIDVVYAVGYVKLLITLIKYMPQVYTNYKHKSTVGWSITQILLDLVGGVLSVVQLVIDSKLEGDWSGVTGNPVKFGLGNVSVAFDVVFMLQHYVLYRQARAGGKELEVGDEAVEGERRRLLDGIDADGQR
ncbi:MAG: hypothetical protein L6R40_006977 [Gallowayella cf. fulva]|nr:MAG: hypothetical protein L6R40_006977 [Xanthomendoza cf. fulva]